jgi:hypothetical protein
MTQAQKQILRNLRVANGSIVTDKIEKAITRNLRKHSKQVALRMKKLYKQVRAEVDAQLANEKSWESFS